MAVSRWRPRLPGIAAPSVHDALAALGCALPFPMIALVVRYGPSTIDPCTSPLLLSGALWLAALGFAVVFLLSLWVLGAPSPPDGIARCSLVCMLAVTASATFGTAVHRDFFSAVFMYILAFLALYFYYLRSRPLSQVRYETFRSVGRAGYVIFLLFTVWIMMMGYAISTRAEPRPIESVIYNCYNALLDVAILFSSRHLLLRSYRTLSLGSGDAVFLDGAPIDFVLGSAGLRILHAFLSSPERKATCADIGKAASDEGRPKRRSDCASCDAEGAKASLCPEYRATYNRILELKKLLEFLEVGSILPPQNKRRVLAEGWRLVLFENVRLRVEESGEEPYPAGARKGARAPKKRRDGVA
jgi:hypothetical protein